MSLEVTAIDLLSQAAASEFGIRVEVVTDPRRDTVSPAARAKQVLYRMRREISNPDFADLQIRLDPDQPDKYIWILKFDPDESRLPLNPTEDDI